MSSSTEIWRHLPLLFQRSCLTFGRTCTVIEQLKSSSNKKLTSLRLVGVEGTVNIEALSEALQQNTTLQQVSIGGNFLQTLSLSSPGTQNGILKLFQAIGCLPNLTQVTLQGNEDSEPFPVEALTLLVETNNTRGGKCLEEINCHYVDFLVSTPSAMTDLSQALRECISLKRVKLLSLDLIASHTTTTSATATRLDPLVACLSHCQEVEIGLRHRRPESSIISQRALQSLLSPSGNLQKLTLKRRISLNAQHLAAILQCLSHASCPLQQLQLDEINLQPTTTTYSSSTLWDDLATMLRKNSTLELLDLNFAANTSSSGRMDHKAVLAVTQALRVNQSVQQLSLLGALEKYNAQAWLDLLEHYNFTLQELELSMEDSSNSNNNNNNAYDQQRLQFYLDLNRQPVAGTSCGLRSILRDCNGAIPRDLMQPCVEAAIQLGRSAHDDATDDDEDEDDHWDNTTIRPPPASSTTLGLSALFYLLQQQPALVSALQQHMLTWEEVVAQRLLEKKKRKAQLEDEMERKAYIPLGGASPQLLLLDDDIVALW